MTPRLRAAIAILAVLGIGGGSLALVTRDRNTPAGTGPSAARVADGGGGDANHLGRVALPQSEAGRGTLLPSDVAGPRIVTWEDLVPPQGSGTPVSFSLGTAARAGMPAREDFGQDGAEVSDADIADFVREIDEMRALQPPGAAIRTDLDGVEIRMAGYATPLGFDEEAVTEFLLVPWLGACIHTPPPPANQIVYATQVQGLDTAHMWEPIWVVGTLRATPTPTVLADVGYRIEGARVEIYQ